MNMHHAKHAYGFICYHLWLNIPLSWAFTGPGLYLLTWAGYYAYTPSQQSHELATNN